MSSISGGAPSPEQPAAARRFIMSPAQVDEFKTSVAYRDVSAFILFINDAVRGLEMPVPAETLSPTLVAVGQWLDALAALVDTVPPQKHVPGRFGNTAFRIWLDRAIEVWAGKDATGELMEMSVSV